MKFSEKIKSLFSEAEDYDDYDDVDAAGDDDYEEDYEAEASAYSTSSYSERETMKVVDISSNSPSKPHVVLKKLDRFEDVGGVADVLRQKRIVILNLETCPNDISQRIIDFLYGVVYANSGEIKRVAGRAYIITPHNIPVSGELLDEIGTDFSTGIYK